MMTTVVGELSSVVLCELAALVDASAPALDAEVASAVATDRDIGATVAGGASVIVMPSLSDAADGLAKAVFILAAASSSEMLDCDTSTYASMMTEPARISRCTFETVTSHPEPARCAWHTSATMAALTLAFTASSMSATVPDAVNCM